MSGAIAIELRDLEVRRGKVVLPGLTLDIRAGTVTGLLGPSGSGKPTLMRAIVGVQIVAGGTLTVLGEPAGTAGLRRRVAYTTQAPSVYADLTTRENLAYFARIVDARLRPRRQDRRTGRSRGAGAPDRPHALRWRALARLAEAS